MANKNLNIFKLLSTSLSLVIMLSSCNLPGISAPPTQIFAHNTDGNTATATLQVNSTQTQVAIIPTNIVPITTTPAIPTQIPPNTPAWSNYQYTCELVSGGSNMTMNLTWTDRSDNEESYIVYRNKQAVATLAPNSTTYVDIAFVAPGKMLSYSVEAFNSAWQTSTTTITYGCQ
jgi:hypothetical protein